MHILVIPKEHFDSVDALDENGAPLSWMAMEDGGGEGDSLDVMTYDEVLTLTRSGQDICCEWSGVLINCMASNVKVDCEKGDGRIDIRYTQVFDSDIAAACSCPVTLYFTIRDAAQDRFLLTIQDIWGNARSYDIDFQGRDTATIDEKHP